MRSVSAPSQRLIAGLIVAGLAPAGHAAINIGTTNASDGAFSPAVNTQVDLSQAVAGAWDADNTAAAGKGRYDAAQWAIVYKYSSVNIPAGVTVTFKNHPSRAPVVWLVQGNVNIAGTIKLDGAAALNDGSLAEPGPGGFRGGVGGGAAIPWSPGFGYGGGTYRSTSPSGAGSYATAGTATGSWLYGSPGITQLIGGSGGGGGDLLAGGGAGAGAILIACRGTLTLGGSVTARGGISSQGGGAGGGVRLVSDILSGGGSVNATGASAGGWIGGDGRVRIEANTSSYTGASTPTASVAVPVGPNPDIFPAAAPQLSIISVGGANAPADPRGGLLLPSQDLTIASTGLLKVRLQGTNVPVNWTVLVRLLPKSGADAYAYASLVSGTAASSVWEAQLVFPAGLSAIQARAYAQ